MLVYLGSTHTNRCPEHRKLCRHGIRPGLNLGHLSVHRGGEGKERGGGSRGRGGVGGIGGKGSYNISI
jgi:hypothetical protein